jgi:succinoglycan biosynthesis protein ExoM
MSELLAGQPLRDSVVVVRRRAVCVAVPTFRRPELLERVLGGLARLTIPADVDLSVVVLDNNPQPEARDAVERIRRGFPFDLTHAHVAEPGLSSVRNFALTRAREGFDFLAMIDDDEMPHHRWLAELLRVQQETLADAVVGPVPRIVPRDAPRWLREGGFFELPVFPDRTLIKDGYSGNCLLRVASINRLGLAFDPALNFAGGEDLLFFRQLHAAGAKLAYARRAVAEEFVGAERLSASYILKLNFRRGNTLSLCDRHLGGVRAVAVRPLKACARIALGSAMLAPKTIRRGRSGAVAALCDIALGLGALAGLVGYTYNAYGRPGQKSPGEATASAPVR